MLAAIAAIVVCLLLPTEWWGGTARAVEAPDKEATTLVRAGMEAPDFTVAMIDGSEVTLSKLHGRVVLVNFWATWCGPCKMQGPILEQLKQKIGDDTNIIKIDVDRTPDLAAEYQIRSVPTLIIFKDGTPQWRVSGLQQLEVLEEKLRSYM